MSTYKIKDKQWLGREVKKARFRPEPLIYNPSRDTMDPPELSINFKGLGSLGFIIPEIPPDKWDWLLGSLSSQISRLVELAYLHGEQDAQKRMRKALGIK